jgi:hypothetical protein
MTLTAKDQVREIGVPLEENGNQNQGRQLKRFILHRFHVGGRPVEFDGEEGVIYLGGNKLTPKDWREFRSRLDLLFLHSGALKKGTEPNKAMSSNFLSSNHEKINSLQKGYIRPPERNWWMKLLGVIKAQRVEYIITNEEYYGPEN